MCHESSSKALSETIGVSKGTVTLDDIHDAELLIVIWAKPGTNHPAHVNGNGKCKQNGKDHCNKSVARAGTATFHKPAKPGEIVIRRNSTCRSFLQVRINEDVALLKAIMLMMLEAETQTAGNSFRSCIYRGAYFRL